MIMNSLTLIIGFVFLLSVPCLSFELQTRDFYVSPTGSDLGAGTSASPFATPQRARDAIRALKTGGALTRPVNVIFRQGTYYLSETLFLEPEDSGTSTAQIIWQAAEGEKVVFSGGRLITDTWSNVDGKTWRIDIPDTKGWIRNPNVAEVYQQKPIGPWHFRQLFVDGNRAIRARYPNKSATNPFLYATGGATDYLILAAGQTKAAWKGEPDAQINIVINWRFFNQWNDIVDVDTAAGKLRFGNRERNTTVTKGDWFWIEGVKSELDQPDEWYLDLAAGQLYYMPALGKNPNTMEIVAPFLNRIIYLKGDVNSGTHVKYVHFKGLEFRHTTFTLGHIEPRVHTDAAVMFENAQSCRVDSCHFENIGGYAFWMHLDCIDNRFNGNLVLDAGGGGVLMTGSRLSYMDDTKIYTPGEAASRVAPYLNYITKNTVRHCGKVRYYGGGVHMDSRPACMAMMPGNRISHNHFEDLSRNGVFAFRNQGGNIIEFNRIHNGMQTTIDGAAIHLATMTHENAPNFIMNNYLYDIWGYLQKPNGIPVRHLANGVFLDWATSNTTVKYNYIYNTFEGDIKTIMGNKNLDIANNVTSGTFITPPFVNQVGPGGDSAIGINLSDNGFKNSGVIHFSDTAQVTISGNWSPKIITGFWGLYTFSVLETQPSSLSTITYSIPIPESGNYKISILYPPSSDYASNASILTTSNDSIIDQRTWNMKQGDEHGFSIDIGEYHFNQGATAKVTISNLSADGIVVANSIAYVNIFSGIIIDNGMK